MSKMKMSFSHHKTILTNLQMKKYKTVQVKIEMLKLKLNLTKKVKKLKHILK